MSIQAGVGTSKLTNSREAGKEASTKANENLKGKKGDMIFVFASSSFDQDEVLKGVSEIYAGAKIIGCSTAGEITNQGAYTNSAVVLAINSDSVKFAVGQAGDTDKDSFSAGKKFALSLLEQGDGYKGVIAIPDGLAGNGAEIIRGAQEALGKNILLAGGSAGDDFKSKITYQFLNDKVLSKSVVGCGLKGDLKIGIGVKHGWIPVGVSSEVTKAEGNILYELDNKPALEIYSKYMGAIVTEKLKANPLIAIAEGATHPLGIDMGEDKYLIRQPFFAKADGSLTLAAEVPEGKRMYLMIGDFDSVVDSAKTSGRGRHGTVK